jgi:hypothetical protein
MIENINKNAFVYIEKCFDVNFIKNFFSDIVSFFSGNSMKTQMKEKIKKCVDDILDKEINKIEYTSSVSFIPANEFLRFNVQVLLNAQNS